MGLAARHGRLPAYARELLKMRATGLAPVETVCVTDLWSIAKLHRELFDVVTIVCDPPARAFDLSAVHGLDVLAVHRGPAVPG